MHRQFLKCGDRDDLQNLMEAARERLFPFGDGDEQVGADRSPDLDPDTVGRIAEKPAQSQVLFDPSEKQFYRPAASVDHRDDQNVEVELVAQEYKRLAAFRIDVADAPQGFRRSEERR